VPGGLEASVAESLEHRDGPQALDRRTGAGHVCTFGHRLNPAADELIREMRLDQLFGFQPGAAP